MIAALADRGLEILIVSSGALVTLLIGGLVIYWIINECRTPRAPRRPESGQPGGHHGNDDAKSDPPDPPAIN